MSNKTTAWRCVSQLWDADGAVPYDSVEDFLDMCRTVHGEAPKLTVDSDDVCWHDSVTGECVLAPAAVVA